MNSYIQRIIAFLLLILLSPLVFIVVMLIKLDSPGPAIFKQKRIGRNSKAFNIYKFRTMKVNAPNVPTNSLDSSKYITNLGKFLRKSSLDEIPQLINILKGEMNFIGPRPVIPEEKDLVSLRKSLGIDKALPGITGWAQINGRDEISLDEKIRFDHKYIEDRSLKFDLYILILTVFKVIKAEGIRKVD